MRLVSFLRGRVGDGMDGMDGLLCGVFMLI